METVADRCIRSNLPTPQMSRAAVFMTGWSRSSWYCGAGVVVDEVFFSDVRYFQMFDMSIHSGDIRDQSRKLSEMTPKFGRFRPSKF